MNHQLIDADSFILWQDDQSCLLAVLTSRVDGQFQEFNTGGLSMIRSKKE